MGREATIARRKVAAVAEASVERTNHAIKLFEEIQALHNAFVEKAGKDYAALEERVKRQGALILDLELDSVHKLALAKVIEAIDRDWQERMNTHDKALFEEIERVSQRLTKFETMPLVERFKWLFRRAQ